MVEQIVTDSANNYIRIGDLRIDTEVYMNQSPTPDGDKLFQIVRWHDKEHGNSTRLLFSGRELEKLHRLVKQWRKRGRSIKHD